MNHFNPCLHIVLDTVIIFFKFIFTHGNGAVILSVWVLCPCVKILYWLWNLDLLSSLQLNTLKPSASKGETLQLRLVLSDGVEVTPHNQITGRYMHSDSRAVFSLDSEMRVIKAMAASKAAKIQRTASSSRAPSGSSLDCTKDVPGLDKKAVDGSTTAGKPPRKYKPRKKAKLSKLDECSNSAGGPETQPEISVVTNHSRKPEDPEQMDLGKKWFVKESFEQWRKWCW